ncbi:hypothetical protein TNCV_3694421 [Trichonephila clavipes]|nr:hypothetical protein TNCV_3694421 [Trichonephila clavipes]
MYSVTHPNDRQTSFQPWILPKRGFDSELRLSQKNYSSLVAARMSTMEVDSPDDEKQSTCYQRLKLKGRIATEKMLLKTFHDLQSTFNTSNPSLMETTNAAAAEHQVKLDALVSERDALP